MAKRLTFKERVSDEEITSLARLMTNQELADKYEVSKNTIVRRLRAIGFSRDRHIMSRYISDEDLVEMAKVHTYVEMSKILGFSIGTIANRVTSLGANRKGTKRLEFQLAQRGYTNEWLLEAITRKNAGELAIELEVSRPGLCRALKHLGVDFAECDPSSQRGAHHSFAKNPDLPRNRGGRPKGSKNKRPFPPRPRGKDSPHWRGGRSGREGYDSVEYKTWRTAVFERDHFTCQLCGKKGGDLQADHIKSWSQYPEHRYDVDNGRTLCKPCHQTTPNYGWRGWNNKSNRPLGVS